MTTPPDTPKPPSDIWINPIDLQDADETSILVSTEFVDGCSDVHYILAPSPQESHKLAEGMGAFVENMRIHYERLSETPDSEDEQYELLETLLHHWPSFYAALRSSPSEQDARGYANLGIGAYLINHSRAGEIPELVISLATEHDRATRTVGDSIDNEPDSQIEAKDMLIRIAFANEAGLRALETQLRILREVHFPAAIAASGGAK